MASGTSTAPSAPATAGITGPSAGTSSTTALTTADAARIKAVSTFPFSIPPGTHLETLTGQNWNIWSRTLRAILRLNEIEVILQYDAAPSPVDSDDWDIIQKKAMAYLCLYCAADVYSIVESDADFPTFRSKYNRLSDTYGGIGSTAVFNLWVEITHARLDDGSPLTPQLAKLNEARVKLSNTGMGVSDLQYCLILINALPNSYEVVASTLLASGPASSLKYSEITARIINEEGRKLGQSASLYTARAGKKQDQSNLLCHHCNKRRHIQRDCRKKKKDEAEEEEEEEDSTDNSTTDSSSDGEDSEESAK